MYTNDKNIMDKIVYFLDKHKIVLYMIPIILGLLGSLVIKIMNDLFVSMCFK